MAFLEFLYNYLFWITQGVALIALVTWLILRWRAKAIRTTIPVRCETVEVDTEQAKPEEPG